MNSQDQRTELEKLELLVREHESKCDFQTARKFQVRLLELKENDSACNAGDLGDTFHQLAILTLKTGDPEEAVTYLVKALGLRRIFFGKGHPKVVETMDLVKEIRTTAAKNDTTPKKVDRRRAEYRRAQKSN